MIYSIKDMKVFSHFSGEFLKNLFPLLWSIPTDFNLPVNKESAGFIARFLH